MGCVMSTALGCMLCNHKCSISRLAATFSFFPPNPPSYTVEEGADGECHAKFTDPETDAAVRTLPPTQNKVSVSVHKLVTKKKQSIVLFHFTCPGAHTTLLWSHGNAMDVGEMYFFFVQLADKLRVNVAAYDYAGYGGSTGTSTEANVYADVLAVHDFLAAAGVDIERQLVLYGQSIGSAPTMWLATHRSVCATILHTPLLSGLRVLIKPASCCSLAGFCSPTCVYGLCDPFPNMHRIKRASCPILLVHGTHDQTVDCSHSIELYRRTPEAYRREPYIIKGAGHDNIVEFDPETYFATVQKFLDSLGPDAQGAGMPGQSPSAAAVAEAYEVIVNEMCASSQADAPSGSR